MVRMTCHQPIRDYVARRGAEGKGQRWVIFCLERHVACEVHGLLLDPQLATTGHHFLSVRRHPGDTRAHFAEAQGGLENDKRQRHDLICRFRSWLDVRIATCAAQGHHPTRPWCVPGVPGHHDAHGRLVSGWLRFL